MADSSKEPPAASAAVPGKKIGLAELRALLLRLEETIIFALIERACFKVNARIYKHGEESIWGAAQANERGSFLEHFLQETECVHARMRRYTAEDENAFFPELLPAPALPFRGSKTFLKPNNINVNSKLLSTYITQIVPAVCRPGDDGEYGSSACCDITALQALSKRIHYGKQVAEVKFQEKPAEYTELIRKGDSEGIMKLLTNSAVEEKLLERVRVKAATYGQEITGAAAPGSAAAPAGATAFKIPTDVPVRIYKDFIIPLTKEVEVLYLMQRLDYEQQVAYLGPRGSFTHIITSQLFTGARYIDCATSEDVVQAVLANKTPYGVVPFSNSVSGSLRSTCDVLLKSQVKVCSEIHGNITLHLLAKCGAEEVRRIYSHRHALLECARNIREKFPKAECIEVTSTSKGAELAAKEPFAAAIGAAMAGTLWKLNVVQANMQDRKHNVTRFLVLSRDSKSLPSGDDKTLAVITAKDGMLSAALAVFAQHGVQLSLVESRPCMMTNETFQQQYLLEFNGHAQDENVRCALRDLQPHLHTINVLGSFQASTRVVEA